MFWKFCVAVDFIFFCFFFQVFMKLIRNLSGTRDFSQYSATERGLAGSWQGEVQKPDAECWVEDVLGILCGSGVYFFCFFVTSSLSSSFLFFFFYVFFF
jgi:hypothetical protein